MRRVLAAVALLIVVLGFQATATAQSSTFHVRGELFLAGDGLWRAAGKHGCVGAGVYGDVKRGMSVVVHSEDGSVLARTRLGGGRRDLWGCHLAFRVSLRDAGSYTFQVGGDHAGMVFQDSFDDGGLATAHYNVSLTIP